MTKPDDARRFLAERRTDYIRTFDTPHGAKVLADGRDTMTENDLLERK